MPVVHLENATLDKQGSDDSSRDSSAISNLLDSIKLSSKSMTATNANVNTKPPPIDPAPTRKKQQPDKMLFPPRPEGPQSPGSSSKATKNSMMNFTAITESLSASSEDISEAIGKTFGMFDASTFLKEPSEIIMSETSDVHNFYNLNSNWAALAVPASFSQSRSVEAYSSKQGQSTIPPVWSFDHPAYDKDMIRPERANNILRDIATKTFESEAAKESYADSEFGATWGEQEPSDLRDVSIMDNESVTEIDESVLEDEEDDEDDVDSDDYSVETFQTTDTEHDENFLFGGEQEGLRALGSVLYQLGTCTLDLNNDHDNLSARGRSRSPRTPPANRPTAYPGVETVQSYLGFSEERELRRLQGGSRTSSDSRKPRHDGFFSALFSCGGPLP